MELLWEPTANLSEDLAESFCSCKTDCQCGESKDIEWVWDEKLLTSASKLTDSKLKVEFHPNYSQGTAAVRGGKALEKGRHHYWEIKMLSSIYGTDVMVGVGTKKASLADRNFCSLLGQDKESWGLSYKGSIHHAGESKTYGTRFGMRSIVGVHLDMWMGTLQFYLNRKPLGVAFTGLKDVELYPIVCSTAAMSKMKITTSCSAPASLQMSCLSLLKPFHRLYLSTAFPGLRYLVDGIFSQVLGNQRRHGDDDDDVDSDEDEYKYTFINDDLIFDDFDYALIGLKRRKILKLKI